MIRFVEADFRRLQSYLESYRMTADLGAKAREEQLKRLHKNSLAALQIWALAEARARQGVLRVGGGIVMAESDCHLQISEFFSDLTSANFAALHGLYKPAHMSLRSAIEAFIRGISGIASPEALRTTSVYRLFEIAQASDIFRGCAAEYFPVLQQEYADLCQFTHSATPAHLARNYALANFPRHDTAKLRGFVEQFERVTKAVLATLVLANGALYLDAPVRARDLLDEVVPLAARMRALGGA